RAEAEQIKELTKTARRDLFRPISRQCSSCFIRRTCCLMRKTSCRNAAMNIFESVKLALDAIWAHKLRSFLTLLGVIFGVATVIVVVSLIEGFNKYVDEKIANIGTNAFSLQKFSIEDFSSLDNYEQARRRNKDVTMDDLDALREA